VRRAVLKEVMRDSSDAATALWCAATTTRDSGKRHSGGGVPLQTSTTKINNEHQ
jgi:hypothetical protein